MTQAPGQPDPSSGSGLPPCRLCHAGALRVRETVAGQLYLICALCEATQLAPQHLPPRAVEEEQYRLHENDPADAGYRAFVARVVDPLAARLAPASCGLDFGCGSGPAGAELLRERGHHVALYDPLFAPDDSLLGRQYDFILCCEVAEHFHHPAREFALLARLLKPGGLLAVMTGFETPDQDFARWHYRRDPTHVIFYRRASFRHLAALHGWNVDFPASNVAILQSQPVSNL